MTNKMSFTDLQNQITGYEEDCTDAKSFIRSFQFGMGNSLAYKPDLLGLSTVGTLNEWAFNQICSRLNVPARWVGHPENCPEELKVEILNELAQKYREDTDLLIRMKGDVVRAILSNKYSTFDSPEFIDLIGTAVSTMGVEPVVHRATIGDELAAYIVFPNVTFAPDPKGGKGDDGGLHPALYVSNSERGGGSARVTGAVFRSICTNGCIFGWKQEGVFAVQHRFHSKAAMGLLVAEGIAEALKMSEEATKRFIASQEVKIPTVSLKGIVNDWADRYGLSVDSHDNWLAAISGETVQNGRREDTRLFDVINAATYIAQTRNDLSETERMERMAGDMLAGTRIRLLQEEPVEM